MIMMTMTIMSMLMTMTMLMLITMTMAMTNMMTMTICSESEFLGENCHLSELSEEGEEENQLKVSKFKTFFWSFLINLTSYQVERDARRDDMWGVSKKLTFLHSLEMTMMIMSS